MVTRTNNEYEIIEYLADTCSRHILHLTSKKEYSAIELCDEIKIPVSTVYRKIKLLENSGFIQHVKTVMNFTGNEEKYYRCVVREAIVSFRDGELSISLKKEDYSDKFIRLWKRLSH
jgi:predicted transcriptional regulator